MMSTGSRLLATHQAKWVQTPSRLTSARPPPGAFQHRSSMKHPQSSSYQDSFGRRLFAWYSQKLNTHPLLTKSLTGATIAAAGDVLCQAGTSDNKRSFWTQGWDMRRSFHFFLLGWTFVAPTSHYWYGNLAVHPWTKGQSFVQISKRVLLDQFVWSPVFFVLWLSGFWGLEKNGQLTASELKKDLTLALPDVMVANWILWIPCQYANCECRFWCPVKSFYLVQVGSSQTSLPSFFVVYAVPVKYQVLFTNVVELAWNAYLSFATEGEGHDHERGSAEEKQGGPPAKSNGEEIQFS
jgi:Mpv17 / PMP22 family